MGGAESLYTGLHYLDWFAHIGSFSGALVMWAIAGYSNGEVAGAARNVRKGKDAGRDVRVLWFVDILGATLLLVLMVWKPGHG